MQSRSLIIGGSVQIYFCVDSPSWVTSLLAMPVHKGPKVTCEESTTMLMKDEKSAAINPFPCKMKATLPSVTYLSTYDSTCCAILGRNPILTRLVLPAFQPDCAITCPVTALVMTLSPFLMQTILTLHQTHHNGSTQSSGVAQDHGRSC